MIKAVFFDFDGVLTLEGNGADAVSKALAQQTGVPFDKFIATYKEYASKLNFEPKRYDTILKPLNEKLGTGLTVSDIHEAIKTTKPNAEMLELVKEVRSNGLIIGIITDNNVDRMEVLHQLFNLDEFNPLIISANVGSGKGQNTIFNVALERAGVKPNEAVFIDNTKDNLPAAEKLGIHTYWHNHETNDVQALRRKLLELEALD